MPLLLVAVSLLLGPMGLSAQRQPGASIDSSATAIWTSNQVWVDSIGAPGFSEAFARLAGLRFQERTDYRTPSLDSALALAAFRGPLRNSPWVWFAAARGLQERKGVCAHDRLSLAMWTGHCRRVMSYYDEAIKRDPWFLPAVIDFMALTPWPRFWMAPERELEILDSVVTKWSTRIKVSDQVWRLRALVAADVLAGEEAMERIDAAWPTAITNGERQYLHARLLALMADTAGAEAAYRGAAADTGSGEHLAWIGRDIEMVGSVADMERWLGAAGEDRTSIVESFWSDRDLRDGQRGGSRLVEHFERWHYAFINYRRDPGRSEAPPPIDGRPDCVELRAGGDLDLVGDCVFGVPGAAGKYFDDRGTVWVRHGEPQRVLGDRFFNESWLYTGYMEPTVLHFIVEQPVGGGPMVMLPTARINWMDACNFMSIYCLLSAQQALGRHDLVRNKMVRLVDLGVEHIKRALSTDGNPQRFDKALAVNVGSYGLGSGPEAVTVAADIPLAELRKLASDDGAVAMRWQIRARSSEGAWVVDRDTVQRLRLPPTEPRNGDRDLLVTLAQEAYLPPGTHDLRVVISDAAGTTGALYSRDGITIADAGRTGISDIVLIPTGGRGAARNIAGESVRLSPTWTPGGGGDFEVGYLLTGLQGQSVKIDFTLTKVDGIETTPAVSVSFEERPSSNRDFRRQVIGRGELEPWAYELSVTATLPDGTVQRRTQRVIVR